MAYTYYINASTGNDSRSVEQARNPDTPWLTIQKGLDNVAAGDTIYVAAGTFGSTSTAVNLLTKIAGSVGNIITLQGASRDSVYIYGSIKLAHNYYKVNGLTFDAYPFLDAEVDALVELNTSSYSEISDCNITNTYTISDTRAIVAVGIYGTTSYSTIKNNKIDKHTKLTFNFAMGTSHCLIEGNEAIGRWNTDPDLSTWDCIYLFGTAHTIRGNTLYHYEGRANGAHTDFIQSFGDSENPNWDNAISKDHIIERNFVYDFTGDAQWGNVSVDSSVNIRNWTFRNNIFYHIARTFNCFAPQMKFYNNTFYDCGYGQNIASIIFVAMGLSKGTGSITITGSNKRINPAAGWTGHILTDNTKIVLPDSTLNTDSYYTKTAMDPEGYWDGDTGTWWGWVEVSETLVDETIASGIILEFEPPNNTDIRNNAFIGCGGTRQDVDGWYGIDPPMDESKTTNYNFVCQGPSNSYAAVTGFSEANGVNGGDPHLYDIDSGLPGGFALTEYSDKLIGKGVDLSSLFTDDYEGNDRGSGTWDIGAFWSGTSGGGGTGGPEINLRFTKAASH